MKKLFIVILIAAVCRLGAAMGEGALPPYAYPGEDPVEGAVAEYMAEVWLRDYLTEDGAAAIPAPVIHRVEAQDEGRLLVYGNFWVFNYTLEGKVLACISGGVTPGIMTLEKTADGWAVTALEEARDGTEYAPDIRRFSHGDAELEELYFNAPYEETRLRFIRDYVAANGLDVEAYQDYGWEPVPLAGQTITGLALEVNPEDLTSVAVDARITGYSPEKNTLTVELIVPERFDRDEVLSLRVGDAIYTQGEEVTVRTLTEFAGYLVINEGDYEFSEGSVWLFEQIDGTYWVADWDDNTWITLAEVEAPVTDRLIFLDGIDPLSGEILTLPRVYGPEEFLTLLQSESEDGGPGFAADNVYVAFDGSGQLALIQRYYVPWQ